VNETNNFLIEQSACKRLRLLSTANLSVTPSALSDNRGDGVLVDHVNSPPRLESCGRGMTVEMGGSAALAGNLYANAGNLLNRSI
jgi:DUF917 family protein